MKISWSKALLILRLWRSKLTKEVWAKYSLMKKWMKMDTFWWKAPLEKGLASHKKVRESISRSLREREFWCSWIWWREFIWVEFKLFQLKIDSTLFSSLFCMLPSKIKMTHQVLSFVRKLTTFNWSLGTIILNSFADTPKKIELEN